MPALLKKTDDLMGVWIDKYLSSLYGIKKFPHRKLSIMKTRTLQILNFRRISWMHHANGKNIAQVPDSFDVCKIRKKYRVSRVSMAIMSALGLNYFIFRDYVVRRKRHIFDNMLTALFIQHDQGFHPHLVALQTSKESTYRSSVNKKQLPPREK